MTHTARAQHAADRIAARLGKCDKTTSTRGSAFVCDLPAGHLYGHYWIGAEARDHRHADDGEDPR